MPAIEVTSQKAFKGLIQKGVTLVDFHADWCGPCKAQAPIIDELDQNFKGRANVAKLDIDSHKNIAVSYGIQSIPTVIIFKDGREVRRFVGLQASGTMDEELKKALS